MGRARRRSERPIPRSEYGADPPSMGLGRIFLAEISVNRCWRRVVPNRRHLVRNARLLLQSAAQHLIDDPALFAVQVSRRLPLRMRVMVGTVLQRAARRVHHGDGAAALGAFMAGDKDEADRLLLRPEAAHTRMRDEVALLLDRPDLITAEASPITRARVAWTAGDLSKAVSILEQAGRGGTRYAERLRSELRLLQPGFHLPVPGLAAVPPSPEGQPLRVLHLITNSLPHTQSGYSVRTHNILRNLRNHGIQSVALTRTGYPVMIGRPLCADEDVVDGIRYCRTLPAALGGTPEERLQQEVREATRIANEFKPHVLHATTDYRNALVAQAVSAATGIPWILEVRGLMEKTWVASHPTAAARQHAEESEKVLLIESKESSLARTASAVVTLSRTMADELERRGVDPQRITLVPNGIDPDLFDQDLSPADARAHLGGVLPPSALVVGAVSALVGYEGFDVLLQAVAEILEDEELPLQLRDRLHIALIGDGTAAPSLARSAQEVGLGDRILMPGKVPREDARLWVQALDVVVVARRDLEVTRAVTPQKPIEAMALGRPVVLSDLPALRETVTDAEGHEHGVIVPPDDPQALAGALVELLEGHRYRRTLTDGARRAARERTWPAMMRRYELAYCAVVQKSIEEKTRGE